MINASCLLVAVLYSVFLLKVRRTFCVTNWPNRIDFCSFSTHSLYFFTSFQWQTKPHQRSIAEVGCCGILPDFFDHRNIMSSFRTLLRKRPHRRRTYLWLFMFMMALYTFQRDEKPLMYLYTQLKLNWDTAIYSNYRTFQSSAYVIMMLTGIPLMSRVFGWPDTVSSRWRQANTLLNFPHLPQVIVMIGAMAHAMARFFFIFANDAWVLYLGAAVSSLGPIVAPVLRSMTSKIVPVSERGKVFALLSVFDNCVPLISGVLYTQVYNNTIDTHPAGIFWLTMGTQLAVFSFMVFIQATLRGRSLEVDELDEEVATGASDLEKEKDTILPVPEDGSSRTTKHSK